MNGSPLFRTIEPMPETSEMTDPMTDHGNDHRPHGRADLMRDLTAGESQCTARSKRTGQRCRLASMLGGNVCRAHGGAAPQTKAKAQRRLQQAADALVQRLLGMALDGEVADHLALAAIRDALDRAGLSAKTAVEVEVALKPWEQIADDAFTTIDSGSLAAHRAARGGQPPPALAETAWPANEEDLILEAEVIGDERDTADSIPTLSLAEVEPDGQPQVVEGAGMMPLTEAVTAMARLRLGARGGTQLRRALPQGRAGRHAGG